MASAQWEARNARARALGYESYYDYRAHGYGSRAPDEPRATGENLARLRGHRGAADLERDTAAGKVAFVAPLEGTRDRKGRLVSVDLEVTYKDGSRRVFRARGAALKPERARRLRQRLDAAGVDYRAAYVLGPTWSARAA